MAEVYPRILQLAEGRPDESAEFSASNPELRLSGDFYPHWLAVLSQWFQLKRGIDEHLTSHDLDYFYRLLTEVVPERRETPADLAEIFRRIRDSARADGRARGGRDHGRAVAGVSSPPGRVQPANAPPLRRYGLLNWRWETHLRTKEPIQPLLADYDAWLEDYKAVVGPVDKRGWRDRDALYSSAMAAANRPCRPTEAVDRSRLAAKARGIEAAKKSAHVDTVGPPRPVARVKFAEIPIENSKCDGFSQFLSCGQDGDAAWQAARRRCSFPPAARRTSFPSPASHLHDVRWDGRQLWIATGGAGDPSSARRAASVARRCGQIQAARRPNPGPRPRARAGRPPPGGRGTLVSSKSSEPADPIIHLRTPGSARQGNVFHSTQPT